MTDAPAASPEPQTSRAQFVARAVFAGALLAITAWTLWGFLPALAWAGIIAIATWPFYRRIREGCPEGFRHIGLPVLFTFGVGLVFILPVAIFGWMARNESLATVAWIEEIRHHGSAAPQGLVQIPYLGASIANWWHENLETPEAAAAFFNGINRHDLMTFSGSFGAKFGHGLLIFIFTLLALFFLYRDGDAFAAKLDSLATRLFGPRGKKLGHQIVESVHGTVDGLVLVGFGEGLVLAIGYYFTGVPQPMLLGVATAIGAVIPFGAFVMFSIASGLLIYQGATFAAIFIFGLGLFVLFVADHIVRPIVIGNATRLPFVWVLLGILGGVETWGLLGLFLGPAMMSVLVDLWREATNPGAPAGEA